MPHNLHRADCPCLRCERPRHPSEVRMGLRGVINALPLAATLWACGFAFVVGWHHPGLPYAVFASLARFFAALSTVFAH